MPQPTIVVGVDDSPATRAALRWAADLARSSGGTLRAVHVLPWPGASEVYACSVLGDPVQLDPVWLEDLDREACRAAFDEVAPEPGWTLGFLHGHVGRVLVQESREARVLVLGAREHRTGDEPAAATLVVVGRPHRSLHVAPWSRPVAARVLAASGCPLLVAPSDDPPTPVSAGGRRGARERRR